MYLYKGWGENGNEITVLFIEAILLVRLSCFSESLSTFQIEQPKIIKGLSTDEKIIKQIN